MSDEPIKCVNDFLRAVTCAEEEMQRRAADLGHIGHFYYRGVSNKKYDLVPSLLRSRRGGVKSDDLNETYYSREGDIISSVEMRYPCELKNRSYIEKLAWMQHYGFPTRLLDVTKNVLVALYFAAQSTVRGKCRAKGNATRKSPGCAFASDTDGAVYVLGVDPYEYDRAPITARRDVRLEDYHVAKSKHGLGSIKYNRKSSGPSLLLTPELTERQKRQCGEFFLMGNELSSGAKKPTESSSEMTGEERGDLVEKIIVDKESKASIREELKNRFGLTKHFLFPESPSDCIEEILEELKLGDRSL